MVCYNAGTAVYKSIEETTEEDWDSNIDTNLKGIFLIIKYSLSLLDGNSVIVNISSGAGRHGFANFTAYCASKFGVIGFTEALADELKEKGIKVCAVCPGGVNTKLYHRLWPGSNPKELIQPEKVASKIVDLCFSQRQKSGSAVIVYNLRDVKEYIGSRIGIG